MEPIAITGFAFKLPQGAEDERSFWDILEEGKNVMTPWPESRGNIDAFYNADPTVKNMIHSKGAHFLNGDPASFDAPFFSITSKEAASMDPQQRLLLETTYRALENAGTPLDHVAGTKTGVYSGCMTQDYMRISSKDPDEAPTTISSGTSSAILANRLSWYFDMKGPSIQVDTACSSSMIATHLAVQGLQSGQTSMALVTGSNMILSPEMSIYLSNMNMLSPDGVSYSFDHRANGYARGEGIVVLVLKRLRDAIRDQDSIRAIIRATGTNQDGHTPGLTQPSSTSQQDLIRDVYKSCNLDLGLTRYVEAHGTGTQLGDSTEANALGRVFRGSRSPNEPLYIIVVTFGVEDIFDNISSGSLKANFGHLEGASGVASILKCIMILEKGIIPPNALFEKWNPNINAKSNNIQVPTSCISWPSEGLRRVSVNSFGFGGSNGHLIMDDTLNTMHTLSINGNRHTLTSSLHAPMAQNTKKNSLENLGSALRDVPQELTNGTSKLTNGSGPLTNGTNSHGLSATQFKYQLLVWSARDEPALMRMLGDYTEYFESQDHRSRSQLGKIAYTLAARRSTMTWRSFAVVSTESSSENPTWRFNPWNGVRPSRERGLAFVFTGQGAQYAKMGLELLQYPVFKRILVEIGVIYHNLGAEWSILDELRHEERINTPQLSQPLCTALQIALVELLASFGIVPDVVVGHSSGEIAAAYAVGALSLNSACRVAYHRGRLVGQLLALTQSTSAMMSVNLPEGEVNAYLAKVLPRSGGVAADSGIHISCINSPSNVTLSGDEAAIDKVKEHLDRDGIFAQKLKTGVAYHSPAMESITEDYLNCLRVLEQRQASNVNAFMISSVTGCRVSATSLSEGQYWADNLVSPVRFADAIQYIVLAAPKMDNLKGISDYIEIGPHGALRRPINDTLTQATGGKAFKYSSILSKFDSPVKSTLDLVGNLFAHGFQVSVTTAIQTQEQDSMHLPVDLPQYPFDRLQLYWHESRLSRDWRLRGTATNQVLGVRASDWNPLQPRWRKILSVEQMPWLAGHVIGETILFPATGTIMMALEAVKQMANGQKRILGYHVKKAVFTTPIVIQPEGKTEIMTSLRPLYNDYEKTSSRFEIQIFAYLDTYWNECFKATIHIGYEEAQTEVDGGNETQMATQTYVQEHAQAKAMSTKFISKENFYTWLHKQGLKYGEDFSRVKGLSWDGDQQAVAHVDVGPTAGVEPYEGIVHPAIFDAACQIGYLAPSKGVSERLPTIVPHEMHSAWISATGWQYPHTERVSVVTKGKLKTVGTGFETSLTVLADDGSTLCHVEKFELLPILSNESTEDTKRKLLHQIEWKPQLSFLSVDELKIYCNNDDGPKDEKDAANYLCELERALRYAVKHSVSRILYTDWSRMSSHMKNYVAWMERQVQATQGILASDEMEEVAVQGALEDLKMRKPSWRLFIEIAQNLDEIVRGEVHTLDLYCSAAQDLYDDLLNYIDSPQLISYLELLVHQNPSQRILEIGTDMGGMTDVILSALQRIEARTGGAAYSEYMYTGESTDVLDKVKERFIRDHDRMSFEVFDPQRDTTSQAFQPESYDTIIASNVLHTTKNVSTTLQNLRGALKPGGHLIFYEITASDSFLPNFGFGILPNWWCGEEKQRGNCPTMTESEWDHVLKENGFSGNDLIIRDYQDDAAHCISLIISTAEDRDHLSPEGCRVLLVVDDENEYQKMAATSIMNEILASQKFETEVFSITELTAANVKRTDYVIFLADLGKSLLLDLSESTFNLIKGWLQQATNLLWITLGDVMSESSKTTPYPYSGIKDGLLRTIRAEFNDKRIISLSIEDESQDISKYVKQVFKVFDSAFQTGSSDLEYCIRDGKILTARLIEDIEGNKELTSSIHQETTIRTEPWLPGPPIKLDMAVRGQIETLHYREDSDYCDILGADEVEIEVKAWALNFRDLFGALGRLDESFDFGSDCAGVVKRIGPQCTSVQPGDRVCMCASGCMRTYPRASEWAVVKIPDSISFEEACAVINPAFTSWQCLIEVARLQKGEKVLIHSAAGATGQLAIQIAQMVGAEVFATVGYEQKKQLLIDQYQIPAENIFYSRNTTFASGIMRVTNGYGVDVVLNSLVGEGLRASWECIAPHGRFIEIGKADINANSSLPMSSFAKNVSFAAVDLRYIFIHKQAMAKALLHKIIELVENHLIYHPKPLHIYEVCDVEDAFRYFQSGKNTGRIVIRVDPSVKIQKHLTQRRSWIFEESASYLVAGGLGGIGRSILKWMASKGAKYLIVPSRSGVASEAAVQIVNELSQQGVIVVTPQCDVSSLESLSELLETCGRTMPPVRGCINATMVLQDTIFDNMTHEQWESTIQSKVPSSWNLHKLLPDLDFFILLSSVSGVIGNAGQANYAAGCTFQDSLARYRTCHGQRAVSIDLGPMSSVGVVAESDSLQRHFDRAHGLIPVQEVEFLSILDMYCGLSRVGITADDSRIIIGLATPADILGEGLEAVEFMQRPLFAYFREVRGISHSCNSPDSFNAVELFRQLQSAEERTAVVVMALSKKLARALSINPEDIDTDQPLHAFGVDSLVAVELRNWIAKDFAADIPVFDITGGRTIAAIGELVTKTSQIRLGI
ncbi:polyketide synthase [Sclerotinia borealis F-4128]|uniref:Polyketide synthase n=1 Tax=Sclerotinia borealis (strain F-4128) TaxID=1432307 RepID=W9CFW2_SCLBF|nr:polyketide synthase [Sclerotinia borealis F-4128]